MFELGSERAVFVYSNVVAILLCVLLLVEDHIDTLV